MAPSNRYQVQRNMTAAIPADQAYYWSAAWQAQEGESREALDRGDFVVFDSDDPNDIVRWLIEGR